MSLWRVLYLKFFENLKKSLEWDILFTLDYDYDYDRAHEVLGIFFQMIFNSSCERKIHIYRILISLKTIFELIRSQPNKQIQENKKTRISLFTFSRDTFLSKFWPLTFFEQKKNRCQKFSWHWLVKRFCCYYLPNFDILPWNYLV